MTPDHYLSSDLTPSDPPTTLDPAAPALLEDIRKLVLTDRELADKAAKAFVSSLHAYTKHEASFIFRVSDLDFHGLAMAYGLLRLPAMPEVRDWRKRVEAEKVKRDKAREEGQKGQEVEEPEDVGWEEADVDVSASTLIRPVTCVGARSDVSVGHICIRVQVERSRPSSGD